MLVSIAMLSLLATSTANLQAGDPLFGSLPGQLIPQDQSITVCPDGASAFRMMRDGYHPGPGIIDIDRYFSALRGNRCEQLSGPAIVSQVIQVRHVPYPSGTENVFVLVRAEDGNGRSIFGIYEPALSTRTRVDSVFDSALNHTTNGYIGGHNGTYFVCPDSAGARRVVRNVPAKEVSPDEERVAIFERNLANEGCRTSGTPARLTDAYEFAGFAAGGTMGGSGAYSGAATTFEGRNVAIVLPVSF